MDNKKFLDIMHRAELLKCNTRHSWTSNGRHESVADHSWRICLMSMLLRHQLEEEFPSIDMDKVLRMCVLHDLGESFTGDIPAFDKSEADSEKEKNILSDWFSTFGEPYASEYVELLEEMEALETIEAKAYKALDKLEAVIEHDEADISTWLPLEYDLQLSYSVNATRFSKVLDSLRESVDADTRAKIKREGKQ